jgi:hypothetical protein
MKSSIPDWDHVIKSEVHSSLDEAPLSKEIDLEINTNAAREDIVTEELTIHQNTPEIDVTPSMHGVAGESTGQPPTAIASVDPHLVQQLPSVTTPQIPLMSNSLPPGIAPKIRPNAARSQSLHTI